MLNLFIYTCTEYTLYIQRMFAYLASLYEPLWHNTIEYIYALWKIINPSVLPPAIDK